MGKLEKLVKKLASGEWAELSFRLREELIRRGERSHHRRRDSLFDPARFAEIFSSDFVQRYSRDSELDLLAALRAKQPSDVFPGFACRKDFADYCSADEKARILKTADAIVHDKFPIFNFPVLSYGSPPQWNYDPLKKKRAPAGFYADIDFLEAVQVGDAKVTWEISRFQFVYDLGQAFILTGDSRYPRKFFDLLIDWNEKNPDHDGINYCSALEFAFRAHSLVWSLCFFRDFEGLRREDASALYRLIYVSGCFLENHPSRYFAPNTHLLGEAYGLYLIGASFPEFSQAAQWRETGRKILLEELANQFTSDGMHAELSTAYHAYSVEFILSALTLAKAKGEPFPDSSIDKFKAMIDVLEALQLPDGTWSHIGDEDGGRLYFLSRLPSHDFRPILEASRAYLNNPDQKPTFNETFWLCGKVERKPSSRTPRKSETFAASGISIIRGANSHAIMQHGPFGYLDCPHSHADHLHLDLSLNGERLLVDPGTLVYTGDPDIRNRFRGCISHNGPSAIDFEFYENIPFAWLQKPYCHLVTQVLGKNSDYIHAQYSACLNDKSEILLQRRVLRIGDRGWLVKDTVDCSRPIIGRWSLISPQRFVSGEQGLVLSTSKQHLKFHAECSVKLRTEISECEISDDYLSTYKGSRLTLLSTEPSGEIQLVWGLLAQSDRIDENCVVFAGSASSATKGYTSDCELGVLITEGSRCVAGALVNASFADLHGNDIVRYKTRAELLEL